MGGAKEPGRALRRPFRRGQPGDGSLDSLRLLAARLFELAVRRTRLAASQQMAGEAGGASGQGSRAHPHA